MSKSIRTEPLVEAELSRLREQRETWKEAKFASDRDVSDLMRQLTAAEARCARLQQALHEIEHRATTRRTGVMMDGTAPFEHEGQAVAAPAEWYGGLAWESELARDVLALVNVAKAAEHLDNLAASWREYDEKEGPSASNSKRRAEIVGEYLREALAALNKEPA